MILNKRKRYLQVALNSTISDAQNIIFELPQSDRILIEAGTPLIKEYGADAIRQVKQWCMQKAMASVAVRKDRVRNILAGVSLGNTTLGMITRSRKARSNAPMNNSIFTPYVVADLKTMDRGDREAEIAAEAGASAAICLGLAPIETIDSFIASCSSHGIDSMIDMMNVEYPLGILRKLKKVPDVVIVHRGVDEEKFNKEKMIPLHEIHRIKGAYDIMLSIAGGDTIREVQRAIFNDADIVVVWKEFYQSNSETAKLAREFLKEIK